MPKIINFHKDKELAKLPTALYIGRTAKSSNPYHFGNPFSHLETSVASVKVSTREISIQAYREWLQGIAYQDIEPERRQWILNNLDKIGKAEYLTCWCAPLSCHGEVLIEFYKGKYETNTT